MIAVFFIHSHVPFFSNFFVAVDEGGKREEKGRGKKKKEKKKEERKGKIMSPNSTIFASISFNLTRHFGPFLAQDGLKVGPGHLRRALDAHLRHVQHRASCAIGLLAPRRADRRPTPRLSRSCPGHPPRRSLSLPSTSRHPRGAPSRVA